MTKKKLSSEDLEKIAGTSASATDEVSFPPVPGPYYPPTGGFPPSPPAPPAPPPVEPPTGGGGDNKDQEDEILKGIAKVTQALALDGLIPSDWVVESTDVAGLAAGLAYDNYIGGNKGWQGYKAGAGSVWPGTAYVNYPINWNNFDWPRIPGADTAANYSQAMQAVSNYMNSLK